MAALSLAKEATLQFGSRSEAKFPHNLGPHLTLHPGEWLEMSSLPSRPRNSEQVAAIDLNRQGVQPDAIAAKRVNRSTFEFVAELPYYQRRFVKKVTLLHQFRFNDSTFPHFPHNLAPDYGQYIGERLELSSQ